jgi:MerR family transcriptional regulator/heat shock protein HspR
MPNHDRERPLYMISVAAELAGVHPQTLRIYENKGLVSPKRTSGNTRMYSQADIDQLELIGQLTAEGINLAGVMRIMDLEHRLSEAQEDLEKSNHRIVRLRAQIHEYELRQQITALVRVDTTELRRIDD